MSNHDCKPHKHNHHPLQNAPNCPISFVRIGTAGVKSPCAQEDTAVCLPADHAATNEHFRVRETGPKATKSASAPGPSRHRAAYAKAAVSILSRYFYYDEAVSSVSDLYRPDLPSNLMLGGCCRTAGSARSWSRPANSRFRRPGASDLMCFNRSPGAPPDG